MAKTVDPIRLQAALDKATAKRDSYEAAIRAVADMAKSAKDWGLVITYAGAISGGEFVLAYASSPKLADIAGVDKGYATHYGDLVKGRHQDPPR